MARYQVAIIDRPENWQPESMDDVPTQIGGPVEVLAETEDLFAAVDRAIEHNDGAAARRRWAVVIERGTPGRLWPGARLCTPVRYRVMAIGWPDGWEPDSPLDVPNCVWQAREPMGEPWLDYSQAEAAMLGLNRQCMDHPGAMWHVVVAVENEPLSRSVSYEPDGTEITAEVRRIHVIRPAQGGRGDCRHCPAGAMACAKAEWTTQAQTVTARASRAFGAAAPL
jgi:hypothetical protein